MYHDKDSINLERRYAQADMLRRVHGEWDVMTERTLQLHKEDLIAEGLWDTVKGYGQKAVSAVRNRLMVPFVKWLQKQNPKGFAQILNWSKKNQQGSFDSIKESATAEDLLSAAQAIHESEDHQAYALKDLYAEGYRIETRVMLDEAWSEFNKIKEDGSLAAAYAETSVINPAAKPDPSAVPAGKPHVPVSGGTNYVGNIKRDGDELKKQLKGFMTANPKMAEAGKFDRIQSLLDTALARTQRGAYFGDTPAGTEVGSDVGSDVPVATPGPSTDGGTPDAPAAVPGTSGTDVPGTPTAPVASAGPGDAEAGGAAVAPAAAASGGDNAESTISKMWAWAKRNPGRAMTVGGIAAILAGIGLGPAALVAIGTGALATGEDTDPATA